MKTQRIEGTDIQAALREVRRVMGPDAVIMSTRETPEGIEIVAAAGVFPARRAESAPQRRAESAPGRRAESAPGRRAESAPDERAEAAPAPRVRRRRVASGGFATLVAGLARPAAGPAPDPMLALDEHLDAMGLAGDVRASLRDAVAGAARDVRTHDLIASAHTALATRIRVEGPALMRDGGRVAVVGGTGVGKTTTIAKLAAHFARRHGPGTVALVNADHYRIGASDQLRRFGQLIGIPVHDVHGPQELAQRLAQLADRRLVLVDTAGMAPGDVRLEEQMSLLAGARVEAYLALSLNMQTAVLARTVRASAALEPRGLILTKEDEAVSLGGGLSMAVRHALPVSFVTNGPAVPADILLADGAKLVARAAALAARSADAEPAPGAPREVRR